MGKIKDSDEWGISPQLKEQIFLFNCLIFSPGLYISYQGSYFK